jgi:hypothetical protein
LTRLEATGAVSVNVSATACIRRTDGTGSCAGDNYIGLLGRGYISSGPEADSGRGRLKSDWDTPIVGGIRFSALGPGITTVTRGLDMAGTTYCWGQTSMETVGASPVPGATKSKQWVFESSKRIDVGVIRRFIQQQQISTGFQKLREMETIPLTTRNPVDSLLLISTLEVEARQISASADLTLTYVNHVERQTQSSCPTRLFGYDIV